jgi:hypothetical protein
MNTEHTVVFIDHIREQALRYFPGLALDQTDVQLVEKQERPSAVLYRFKLKDKAQTHSIIVKVPLDNPNRGRAQVRGLEKPLLFPRVEFAETHWLHYTALASIHEYFTGLGRKEFGTIRVLDYLPQYQAVIMEESSDPKLSDLLLKESRLHSPLARHNLHPVFEHVGAWLHVFHKMPKKEHMQVRHQRREEYIESIATLTGFLAGALGEQHFFEKIAARLAEKAREVLPEVLPIGLGHGDYAMRNILVSPSGRVTVLDTFAKWQTPIYEDIGYFLTGLKMTYPQVVSQGLMFSQSQLMEYEQAFLKGYFGEKRIPYPEIRLYEMLALLDKWSSVLIWSYKRSSKKAIGSAKASLVSLYFKRMTSALLREITGVTVSAASMDPERSY